MKDDKLWKVFSDYIRRSNADDSGLCTCATCGVMAHWKDMDADILFQGITRLPSSIRKTSPRNAKSVTVFWEDGSTSLGYISTKNTVKVRRRKSSSGRGKSAKGRK